MLDDGRLAIGFLKYNWLYSFEYDLVAEDLVIYKYPWSSSATSLTFKAGYLG